VKAFIPLIVRHQGLRGERVERYLTGFPSYEGVYSTPDYTATVARDTGRPAFTEGARRRFRGGAARDGADLKLTRGEHADPVSHLSEGRNTGRNDRGGIEIPFSTGGGREG